MLFHALPFVFLFLPATLGVFLLLERGRRGGLAALWLLLASLVFYGTGEPAFLGLLVGSIVVNFALGTLVAGPRRAAGGLAFAAGIAFNLGTLGLFKYADFLGATLAGLADRPYSPLGLALPLGISFFTFQQIAWLADLRSRRHAELPRFRDYALFIAFFPQLVAGPIVHWGEMGIQLRRLVATTRPPERLWRDLAVGLSLFAMGLAKKIWLADGCARVATPLFAAAETGGLPAPLAWGAMLAYTLQIYFDFSGYSDMALGLARLFGLRLPANFYSPYRQSSMIDFWRTWHMTLSRFLRDYVYIPLGGGRKGPARRYLNLVATMLVGGLWHGAAWTFVAWGGVHGLLLAGNHAWRRFAVPRGVAVPPLVGWALTFFAVAHAWILFRAESFEGARRLFLSLYGLVPADAPPRIADGAWIVPVLALTIALVAPNSLEIFRRYRPALGLAELRRRLAAEGGHAGRPARSRTLAWRPAPRWVALTTLCLAAYLYLATRAEPYVEFIYFRF